MAVAQSSFLVKHMLGEAKFKLTKEQRKEAGLKSGSFTEADVAILKKGIETFKNLNNLQSKELLEIIFEGSRKDLRKEFYTYLATEVLPSRARSAIYYRVKRIMHPNNFKGPYTKEEDDMILKLHKTVGNNWKHIGEVLDRMPESCRDRFIKYLKIQKDQYNKGEWSLQEEEQLIEIVKEYLPLDGDLKMSDLHKSIPWEKVSLSLKVRDPTQCLVKWNSGLSSRLWQSVNANILNNNIILKKANNLAKAATKSVFLWTYQDDMNLLNAIQMENKMRIVDIQWSEVAVKITHALANNLQNDTSAEIRCFSGLQAKKRFLTLKNSVFNGKNLSVLDTCLYYLEKDCKRLHKYHYPQE